jgi:hypothetical protein
MLTEDYIMRMINMALAVLVKILGFKQAGQYNEAAQHINQALEMLMGMRADLVKRLDDDSLIETLTIQETLDTDRLLVVADLFKEDGDILASQQGQAEAYPSRLRALNFYLEVVLSDGPDNLPKPDNKIEELLIVLDRYDLPLETLYSLFAYYAHLGELALAENTLQRMADVAQPGAEIKQEIFEFYQDMLSKSDEELVRGGLTRDKINDRLKAL